MACEKMRERFDSLTEETSEGFTYLGMFVRINKKGNYEVDMEDYIKKAVVSHLGDGKAVRATGVPAQKDLFEVEEGGLLLSDTARKKFHSTTARILYLTNHTRPALKVACQFLCTRVQSPTEGDKKKLRKLLMYLWTKKKKKMMFKGENNNHLRFYVDGAFACHPDGKSHTGLVVQYGENVVMCQSKKQKICTKDSTEAEIVSVSDEVPEFEWVKECLLGQGKTISSTTLF